MCHGLKDDAPNSYVEALMPRTSECDCVWRQSERSDLRLNEVVWVGSKLIELSSYKKGN